MGILQGLLEIIIERITGKGIVEGRNPWKDFWRNT